MTASPQIQEVDSEKDVCEGRDTGHLAHDTEGGNLAEYTRAKLRSGDSPPLAKILDDLQDGHPQIDEQLHWEES